MPSYPTPPERITVTPQNYRYVAVPTYSRVFQVPDDE